MKFLGWIFFIFIGLIIFGSLAKEENKRQVQELMISNDWRSDGDISIGRALVKNRARGCGYFEYIQVDSTEYIVRCGFPDEGYKYYVAFTSVGKALGPYSSSQQLLDTVY